ncbi:aadbdaf8-3e34-4edc-90cf-c71bfcf36962 [Thermothielavioides terrestris]|uniref:Uncharacterized protein n=2 Tax=Thermothielavioides terrestris TaxID=2587410 RepID=G2R895_THETT|nr:uncharacterized protein THITE_160196 [Thermothielavioides terrestris NRRL 8126]AEO68154.1 hypothetical protein THITE_160196 [Thermothielavioides terrestris NRRL 8126]SPQ24599.1 aadbdaf8-3e34-4edc-90cf-c71bfcf36962 [Thermothielavioides terrestris]
MCSRKIFIHHRCGHQVTTSVESCDKVECRLVKDQQTVSNRFPCIVPTCVYYGKFD